MNILILDGKADAVKQISLPGKDRIKWFADRRKNIFKKLDKLVKKMYGLHFFII